MTPNQLNTKFFIIVAPLITFLFFSGICVDQSYSATSFPKELKSEKTDKLPNIVFLISEDNSKHFMDLFDPSGVKTPFIRSMADQGITFTHAFSNSPVCSVARSTLITGTLATRTGMHLHRKIAIAPMPEDLEMFPAYLRKAGYYTTNNAKKDYNAVEGEGVWDASSNQASWRDRPEENQPFFHQETFAESHESRLHFDAGLMDDYQPQDSPEQVQVFPIYPDTPLFRFTTAYHRDKIREIDQWVGRSLQKLEEDGLLENTFVFYFGDHGGVLPGSKGYLFETGLHIPLVVRVPENFKHLVNMEHGQQQDGFVSFIDFGPTALNLAGVDVPAQMDGRPFLGKTVDANEVAARDEAFGHADRFDEKYELVRSLRKGKYKYIRSYQPFYPDGLQNNYRYKMLAFSEWRHLFIAGKLDSLESRFFLEKPVEMLFDIENDPFETINLAGRANQQKVLISLRERLNKELLEKNDLGFLPESVFVNDAIANPVQFGKTYKNQLEKLLKINDLATRPFEQSRDELLVFLETGNDLEKYWAITVASAFGLDAAALSTAIIPLTEDNDNMVALRAIEFLGIIGKENPIPQLTSLINGTNDPVEALLALNSMVFFRDHTSYPLDAETVNPQASNDEVKRRMDYLNDDW